MRKIAKITLKTAVPPEPWEVIRLASGVDGILFSEALGAEGAVVFDKTRELGLEGVSAGSLYRSGRSHNCLRSRTPISAGRDSQLLNRKLLAFRREAFP